MNAKGSMGRNGFVQWSIHIYFLLFTYLVLLSRRRCTEKHLICECKNIEIYIFYTEHCTVFCAFSFELYIVPNFLSPLETRSSEKKTQNRKKDIICKYKNSMLKLSLERNRVGTIMCSSSIAQHHLNREELYDLSDQFVQQRNRGGFLVLVWFVCIF